MTAVAVAALLAAACFAAFHLPVPAIATGRPARLLGIAYHLLLLPAVAALPAPGWAQAAGFAWMLIDVVLNGAAYVGIADDVAGPLRQGVHVLSALWVLVAGWTNSVPLGLAGTALAVVFLIRFLSSGSVLGARMWLRNLNAALNVVWIIGVAITLWSRA